MVGHYYIYGRAWCIVGMKKKFNKRSVKMSSIMNALLFLIRRRPVCACNVGKRNELIINGLIHSIARLPASLHDTGDRGLARNCS